MRALVVHTGGGLGDVLLSGPVVDTVQAAGYAVDFLARSGTSQALTGHPNIEKLWVIDSKDPQGLAEMRAWALKLKERRYDVCFLLWSTTRWAWTLYLAGIPVRVGQDSRLAYSFLFTHRVRVRSEHGDEESHWTDILLDYPRRVQMEPVEVKPRFYIPEAAKREAGRLAESFQFKELKGPLLGFHSGKGLQLSPTRWPVAHFALLAQTLQSELQARLVLTGGPNEVEIVAEVAKRLSLPFVNLAGQTELPVLAALQENMDAFVCPDSGPMHLAAAVGTPVVGIYALDEDFPQRWAPFGLGHQIVRPPRPACPPGCIKPNCPNFQCYLKVEPALVVEAVRRALAATDRNLP